MQQYAGIYLLQNYSTYFGHPLHPSSGAHKTVTAASGTGHITYLGNNLPPWIYKKKGEKGLESCSYGIIKVITQSVPTENNEYISVRKGSVLTKIWTRQLLNTSL